MADPSVDLNPIPDRYDSGEFQLVNRGGCIKVYRKNRQLHTDYDAFAVVDGLPVIFEVKMGHYKKGVFMQVKGAFVKNYMKIGGPEQMVEVWAHLMQWIKIR